MSARLAVLLMVTALSAPMSAFAAADPLPPEPTAAEKEQTRLSETHFQPIAELAGQGREIRRASFADMFGENGQPGVTIEKKADGEVRMTVVSNKGRVVDEAILSPQAWTFLAAKEKSGLAKAKKTKGSGEICVGNTVVVEAITAGKVIRRDGDVCNGQADLATLEYARAIAQVAVTSIPRCAGHVENTRDPSWTLRDCLRRSLIANYKLNPYANSSAANNEAFESYATKTWNNVNDELLASLQKEYGE